MKGKYTLEGTMKRLVFCFAFVLLASTMWAQVNDTIVIAPLENQRNVVAANDVETLTMLLENRLRRTRLFNVVDRNRIPQAMTEAKFQTASDWSDSRKTSEIGRVLNASYLAWGTVSKIGSRMYLIVRIYNINTLEILDDNDMETSMDEAPGKMTNFVQILTDEVKTGVVKSREDSERRQREAEWATQEQREAERVAQVRVQMRDAWKNKRMYFGLRGGGNIGFYNDLYWQSDGFFGAYTIYSEGKGKMGGNFAFSFLVQTNDYLAIQTELLYMYEEFEVTEQFFSRDGWGTGYYDADSAFALRETSATTVRVHSFMVPILLKGTFRPSIFSIGALAGIYFNIPLGGGFQSENAVYSPTFGSDGVTFSRPVLGGLIGADFGVKAGTGIVKLDLRYAFDFGITRFSRSYTVNEDFGTRSMFLFTLGYEIGVKDRKGK